jgi:3alpha(or 20beta)-hydroxysteroid dehydrogenase
VKHHHDDPTISKETAMSEPHVARLTGRVALVTGGSRGQGAAHARRMASEGAAVFIGDVLDEDGQQTESRLRADGLDATYLHLDVSDPDSWSAAHDLIEQRHGRLDILVNNAGIIHERRVAEESLDAWNRTLAVNLTGPFLGLRTMLPLLRKGTGPSVINTSSVYGPSGAISYAAYGASKSGLLGLTRTAALELAPDGIRVNALVPGGVKSHMSADDPEGGVIRDTVGPAGRTRRARGCGRVPGQRRRQLHHRHGAGCRRRVSHPLTSLDRASSGRLCCRACAAGLSEVGPMVSSWQCAIAQMQ